MNVRRGRARVRVGRYADNNARVRVGRRRVGEVCEFMLVRVGELPGLSRVGAGAAGGPDSRLAPRAPHPPRRVPPRVRCACLVSQGCAAACMAQTSRAQPPARGGEAAAVTWRASRVAWRDVAGGSAEEDIGFAHVEEEREAGFAHVDGRRQGGEGGRRARLASEHVTGGEYGGE